MGKRLYLITEKTCEKMISQTMFKCDYMYNMHSTLGLSNFVILLIKVVSALSVEHWNFTSNFTNQFSFPFKTGLRNVWFQKISILPPQKGLEIPGSRGGSQGPRNLKECIKLNWNFRRGGGVIGQIPSVGGYGYFLEPHDR